MPCSLEPAQRALGQPPREILVEGAPHDREAQVGASSTHVAAALQVCLLHQPSREARLDLALLAVGLALVVDHLLVERQALVVKRVPHLLALRLQVVGVVLAGRVLDRDLVGDVEAVALQPDDLLRDCWSGC